MKSMLKMVMKYIFYGISLGCTSFVVMCLSYSVGGRRDILAEIFNDFTRQAVGAMIVGLACGGTAIVYQSHRLSGLAKKIIHFGVGMGVFYPVAVYLGWIPFYPERLGVTALQFLFFGGIFMVIWFGFYLWNRKEAKMINERLRERERGGIDGKI